VDSSPSADAVGRSLRPFKATLNRTELSAEAPRPVG
jgi:hypothetical protein